MIFIDTAYLVALAIPSDGLHQIARAWSRAVSDPCVTTEFVLVEFVNRLSEPKHRARAHTILAKIAGSQAIEVLPGSQSLLQSGLTLHRNRPDKAWSLTDCISFEVMRELQSSKALTSDIHFEQAGFLALLRTQPPGA